MAGSPNPGTPTTERVDAKAHLKSFFKLLVGAIGLAYATGFVVVLTFLNEYGIREAGGEFFKLRYIASQVPPCRSAFYLVYCRDLIPYRLVHQLRR